MILSQQFHQSLKILNNRTNMRISGEKKKHEKVMLKLKNVRKKKAIYLNNE